jgi:hypothetical protein
MKVFHFFWHIVLVLAAVAGFSAIVMLLWNFTIPGISGLACINFWQALGLLVLCRLLFGGIGGKFWRIGWLKHHHNPIREKWLRMTPEERKEFVRNRHFKHSFGHDFFNPPTPEKQD